MSIGETNPTIRPGRTMLTSDHCLLLSHSTFGKGLTPRLYRLSVADVRLKALSVAASLEAAARPSPPPKSPRSRAHSAQGTTTSQRRPDSAFSAHHPPRRQQSFDRSTQGSHGRSHSGNVSFSDGPQGLHGLGFAVNTKGEAIGSPEQGRRSRGWAEGGGAWRGAGKAS